MYMKDFNDIWDTHKVRKFAYRGTMPFPILATTRTTDTFTVNDNHSFHALYLKSKIYNTATGVLLPDARVLLQIRINDRNYFRESMPLTLLAGDGRQSTLEPSRYRFPRKTTVVLDYQNLEAVDVDIFLMFDGYTVLFDEAQEYEEVY
ncbi:hypothetical protein LCGC14_2108530 [marine sediment metagenome]|uniref:Uncharacterized protein n=1 Tax=marine sediment metagenome TaxID=412755 RepID=A0A0F9E7P5_9ZZZZ